MMVRKPLSGLGLCAVLAFSLAACQGNIGSGSGLSIPQGPQQFQPGGPQAQSASRERALEGAVYLNPAAMPSDIPLPSVGGFAIDIKLGTAPPSASPTPTPTGPAPKRTAGHRNRASEIAHRSLLLALATPIAVPAPPTPIASDASAVPSPISSAPSGSASAATATSGGVTHLSDVPSPSASGSPVPGGTVAASPVGHHPHSTATSGPKITTKLVAYPDDAPVAPTAEPTGAVQTFPDRKALVRGYLMPAADVAIYGLGAIRFTVPPSELSPTRGYTIAVYTSQKKHKGKLLEYDTTPVTIGGVIASSFTDDPFVFKKSIGYEIVLYADQTAATPVPVPSGYPAAGSNPLPYPSGATPGPGQTLLPGQTPPPIGYPASGQATPLPQR